jgi:hypothetical protein
MTLDLDLVLVAIFCYTKSTFKNQLLKKVEQKSIRNIKN